METRATKAKVAAKSATSSLEEQAQAQALAFGSLTITKRVVEKVPLFDGSGGQLTVGQIVDLHLKELAISGGSPESIKVDISEELWTNEELGLMYERLEPADLRRNIFPAPPARERQSWED